MRLSHPRLLAAGFVALLLLSALPVEAQDSSGSTTGRIVTFPLTRFNDTVFTAVDAAYRVLFDEAGDVWYSTEGGVVHVDVDAGTRRLYTAADGLPSSYSLGLALLDGHVYVATDLGVGIIHPEDGDVSSFTVADTPLPDSIVQDVAADGQDLWVGTRFGGVAVWNSSTNEWSLKNTSTTPGYPQPVRRIVPATHAVWVATDGDGLWRFPRDGTAPSVVLAADGLLSDSVLSVAELTKEIVYVGTDKGLQRRNLSLVGTENEWMSYGESSGMPDRRVLDVDIIPTQDNTWNVFASTRQGVWQLDPRTGQHITLDQNFGILGAYVLDEVFSDDHGWAFATSRGVSLKRASGWSYYATGPTSGPSPGPLSYKVTAVGVGDMPGYVWLGSDDGISAYALPTASRAGRFFNFGEWQNYPGSVVNWVDTDGNTTWLGTNAGTIGYDRDQDVWLTRLQEGSRNLVYGLEADRGDLYVGLFGDGLLKINLTTGERKLWNYQTLPTPLPDQNVLDVRVQGDDIWVSVGVGLLRLNRVSYGTVLGTYTRAEGIPGNGVVFHSLPDGPIVWVGTKDGGVARFDVAQGRVTRVWNATTEPGFPDGEIRSLHREGGRLWVGTKEGLARIDVATGAWKAYNATHGLVQNYVNGIASADGILYLGTLSGLARLDIATDKFLPMQDAPGVVHVGSDSTGTSGNAAATLSVRIDTPRDGSAVTGLVDVRGSALRFGGAVDRVEVKVGEGEWQLAEGTESWSFAWDSTTATPSQPVTLHARAVSGDVASREAEIVLTPVALPTIPLEVKSFVPANATAGRALEVSARAQGDEPLSVVLYYKAPFEDSYKRVTLAREGALFVGTIPAVHLREGRLVHYVEARSGLLTATDPGDASHPGTLEVSAPPKLAVAIKGPVSATAPAGVATALALEVTNTGSEAATFVLAASGLRASWVSLPGEPLDLQPGESKTVDAMLEVPAKAFADNTTITFQARDANGAAEPATATVPVEVTAAQAATTTTPDATGGETGGSRVPVPLAVPLLALLGAALVARRWRP